MTDREGFYSKAKPMAERKRRKWKTEIGTIELGKEVYVSDPCYSTGMWCQAKLKNVRPGTYRCFASYLRVKGWGNRVASLWVFNEEYLQKNPRKRFPSEPEACFVGVDSGQCGIFDAKYYEKRQPIEAWYDTVCETTCPVGILADKCVVSESGFGDGGYNVFKVNDKEETVGIMVEYISTSRKGRDTAEI